MEVAWPSSARYAILSSANWLAFLAAVAFLTWGGGDLPPAATLAIIGVVVASVVGQFAAAYRLVTAQDEFVRGITAKRVIAAAGLTISIAVLWGLGMQFLGWRAVPMWTVYPFFWGAFGMVTPFIRDSHA
jgi:putative oxidoreductase